VADARFQLRFMWITLAVLLVQFREQIEVVAPHAWRYRARRLEIEDRCALGAHFRAAVDRRQPSVLPQERAAGVVPFRIAQDDIGWQTLVFRAEPVANPRAESRPAR